MKKESHRGRNLSSCPMEECKPPNDRPHRHGKGMRKKGEGGGKVDLGGGRGGDVSHAIFPHKIISLKKQYEDVCAGGDRHLGEKKEA